MGKKSYVVLADQHTFLDRYVWSVAVYTNKNLAQQHAQAANAWMSEYRDKAHRITKARKAIINGTWVLSRADEGWEQSPFDPFVRRVTPRASTIGSKRWISASPCLPWKRAVPEASCYTMDLYCDNRSDPWATVIWPLDEVHGSREFPAQFSGTDRADCVRQARRTGWLFKRNGDVLCPRCSGKTPS